MSMTVIIQKTFGAVKDWRLVKRKKLNLKGTNVRRHLSDLYILFEEAEGLFCNKLLMVKAFAFF